MDIREQLSYLRNLTGQTAARMDRRMEEKSEQTPGQRFAPLPAGAGFDPDAAVDPEVDAQPVSPRGFLEDLVSGQVVETSFGTHFEAEQFFARHRRHGSFDISDLADLPPNLLESITDGAVSLAPPKSWAFLDTETTGLAGGSGTYAFLVGVGSIEDGGFRVRQFFLRDYADEPSLLASLDSYLKPFDVLITYNGKSYDQPLLETRYTMHRVRHPFGRMEHLDLLYGARRIYKLRLENCRLTNLEYEILGVERHGDIPGEMIPYCYFEFLRTRRAHRLVPIFQHNVLDIVSLACLTALIPEAFRDPGTPRARHGTDLLGIARWLRMSGRLEESHQILRRAVDLGLPDQYLFRTLFDIAMLEKKMGLEHASVASFTELTESTNSYSSRAYEELAKFYEHKDRNYSMALECTRAARRIADAESLRERQARLELKSAKSRQPRLKWNAPKAETSRW